MEPAVFDEFNGVEDAIRRVVMHNEGSRWKGAKYTGKRHVARSLATKPRPLDKLEEDAPRSGIFVGKLAKNKFWRQLMIIGGCQKGQRAHWKTNTLGSRYHVVLEENNI